MKPPHRKGDSVTASEDTIAKTTDAWATEACYRSDVLQAVRYVCRHRLPMHQSFSATDVTTELADRGLPMHDVTVKWALTRATELRWCRRLFMPGKYTPISGEWCG